VKVRRREVNIFNMSLLDILCGALGAFCFMMLTLFPSYISARDKGEFYGRDIDGDWSEIEEDASNFVIVARWESAHDVDLYIRYPGSGTVYGPKARGTMKAADAIMRDQTRGPGFEAFELTGGHELGALAAYLRVANANGATGPALVHLAVFRRVRLLERSQVYGWAPEPVSVPLEGIVTVGEFFVNTEASTIRLEPTKDPLF
jgi:hypothetical protein